MTNSAAPYIYKFKCPHCEGTNLDYQVCAYRTGQIHTISWDGVHVRGCATEALTQETMDDPYYTCRSCGETWFSLEELISQNHITLIPINQTMPEETKMVTLPQFKAIADTKTPEFAKAYNWLKTRVTDKTFREAFSLTRQRREDGKWTYSLPRLDHIMMLRMYTSWNKKTVAELVIQYRDDSYSVHKWQDVCTYELSERPLAKRDLAEYKKSSSTAQYRLITRRSKNPEYNPNLAD